MRMWRSDKCEAWGATRQRVWQWGNSGVKNWFISTWTPGCGARVGTTVHIQREPGSDECPQSLDSQSLEETGPRCAGGVQWPVDICGKLRRVLWGYVVELDGFHWDKRILPPQRCAWHAAWTLLLDDVSAYSEKLCAATLQMWSRTLENMFCLANISTIIQICRAWNGGLSVPSCEVAQHHSWRTQGLRPSANDNQMLNSLRSSWSTVLSDIEVVRKKMRVPSKGVMFTELGYTSRQGSTGSHQMYGWKPTITENYIYAFVCTFAPWDHILQQM